MREINPRPGSCVCVARRDGKIVYDWPSAYDAYKQGDTPAWRRLTRANGKEKDACRGQDR